MSKENLIIEILDPTSEALKKINKTIVGVILVLGIGFISLLIIVSGLVIDAWHFKSNSYRAVIEKNLYLEKIINEYRLEQKELRLILNSLKKDIDEISDNLSLSKTEKN